ncbi:MAG: hypothetical protein ACYTHJ_15555, partial [Planctomycetota bacterium]
MSAPPNPHVRKALQFIGSIWFGAVLLMLLLVGMACATVFESTSGTERALVSFYHSWWFEALLTLVGINVLAATLARFPFSRRQTGFVCTHVSILVVLAGALVTKYQGLDGQLFLTEGTSLEEVRLPDRPALTLLNKSNMQKRVTRLSPRSFRGFDALEWPEAIVAVPGDFSVEIERYLPDSTISERVVDQRPRGVPAIQVSLATGGDLKNHDHASHNHGPIWIFAAREARVDGLAIHHRTVSSETEMERLLSAVPSEDGDSIGTMKISFQGTIETYPISEALGKTVPF